jgi:hypothetical protein
MPVLIGETGNAGDGVHIAANEATVLKAVETSGVGSAAWAFGITGNADGLTNADGSLTAYGKEIAGYIKANAAAAAPPATPSANDAKIASNDYGASLIDATGNNWTITAAGAATVNGAAAGYTANVSTLAYVDGHIWQENTAGNWWQWTGTGWAGGSATSPLPPPTETISLRMSEDAYKGDAQFTVKVDGTQVGGTRTVTALHGQGTSQVFDLAGLSAAAHTVSIAFINDAYGGSALTDRNLYVDSIAINGATKAGSAAALTSNGAVSFTLDPAGPAGAAPADMLKLNLSGDAYQGNAQFTLSVDGKPFAMPQSVTASHGAAAWQAFDFAASFGAGNHTVAVTFTNDLYAGTAGSDRNLYVNGIDVNGTHYGSGVTSLMSSGDTASYTFAKAA